MIATINLPGSQYFDYLIGSKKECDAWLEEQEKEFQARFGGAWYGAYSPAKITANKEAAKWRYRDGSPVIKELTAQRPFFD